MTAPSDGPPTLRQIVAATLLVLPADTVVIGVTGLRLRGIEVAPKAPLRFATRHPHLIRRTGIAVRRVTALPPRVEGSLPMATVAHCFLTATADLDLVELVVAGDWLLRLKLTTRERLRAHLGSSSERGALAARRAAQLLADRVDSPQESRLRVCLVLAGLPEPRCNVTLGTEDYPIGRVDMVYEEFKVILEYEGDHHRVDRKQWNIDIDRVDEFTAEGYQVVRITSERMQRPRATVTAVYLALQRRGYPGPEPVFTPEWCALFERTVRSWSARDAERGR